MPYKDSHGEFTFTEADFIRAEHIETVKSPVPIRGSLDAHSVYSSAGSSAKPSVAIEMSQSQTPPPSEGAVLGLRSIPRAVQ